ncbi:hypothetical protein J437_LFUL019661 [Ladona fulva]|nr:hypothetical protein J437_LFUL019661 [Ladona fulva]
MMHRPDMRAHFEDLANRHPEFADHLRPTAWGTTPEMDPRFFQSDPFRQRHPSGGSGSGTLHEDAAIPIPVIHEDSGGGDAGRGRTRKIPQYGLRNTVDLGESQKTTPEDKTDGDARSQRSWSAPPDNRTQGDAPNPKRFVTKVDIMDKMNSQPASGGNDPTPTCSSGVSGPGKPPPVPKTSGASSPQNQPQTSKSGNVRHIPIFVEGRDQPVLSKHRDGTHSFASSQSSSGFGQPSYSYSYAQAPPGHHSTAFASSHASSSPPTQRRSQTSFPQASKPQPQSQPQPAPHEPKPTPAKQPPAPAKPALPKDPIAKVQAIQAEVNELKELIDKFSGSRTDKEYIYLDEMLTRNLIKLDDIETEGKENIRLARKEAIRSIQRCISLLESKAPLPKDLTVEAGEEASMEDENLNEASTEPEGSTEKSDGMSEGQTLEKMEVECTENKHASVVSESHSEQHKDATQDVETVSKAGETANISENQQSSEQPSKVTPDQASEKSDQPPEKMEVASEQEKMEIISEQPPDKMEVVSDQPGEKMDVVSEPVSQPNKNSESSVETRADKCDSEVTNNPGNATTETDVGSKVHRQPSAVIADVTVVPETVKPSDNVEAPSEVNESTNGSANPQDSASASGEGGQKNEVTQEESVEESTPSAVPPKEGAEKAVSS